MILSVQPCDTVIYINIYLISVPVSGIESRNPLEFPNDESNNGVSCYVKEVTFGPHPTVGAGYQ